MSKFVTIFVNDWQGRPYLEETINLDEINHFNKSALIMKGGRQFEIGEQAYKQLKEATGV